MRQQLIDFTSPLRRQAREHIFQIGIRIVPVEPRRLDQTHHRCRPFAAAQCPCKEPALASKSPWPDLVLCPVVVYRNGPVIAPKFEVARYPAPFRSSVECLASGICLGSTAVQPAKLRFRYAPALNIVLIDGIGSVTSPDGYISGKLFSPPRAVICYMPCAT